MEKQEILRDFQSITSFEDDEKCMKLLEAVDWNLQKAVENAILDAADSDSPRPGPSSSSFQTSSTSTKDSEIESAGTYSRNIKPRSNSFSNYPSNSPLEANQNQNHSSSSSSPSSGQQTTPTTNHRTTNHFTPPRPSILRIFTMPLLWGFRFIWAVFSFALSFLPFTKSYRRVRSSSNSIESAKEFKLKFASKYGEKCPRFYEKSYSAALEHAKENLQYFLVILQSDTHDDTELFCRQTLTADSFLQYLSDKNILVWGGNVKESEAYKVASTLGASRYPFMALIAYHDSLMKVVHRFEGICPPEECIDVFNRVSNQLDPTYVAIKAERANRIAERSLREEQDTAYQMSLRADREKAERLRLEKEAQEQEALKIKQDQLEMEKKREAKLQRKKNLAASLKPEPDSSVEFVTRMNIRLPNGARLIRKFDAKSTLQSLYDFVETNDLTPIDILSDFVIANTYPRKEYRDKSLTFQAAGLFPNATVLVEELDDYVA